MKVHHNNNTTPTATGTNTVERTPSGADDDDDDDWDDWDEPNYLIDHILL